MAKQEGSIAAVRANKVGRPGITCACGREPLSAMRRINKEWGVELIEIPVAPSLLEQ